MNSIPRNTDLSTVLNNTFVRVTLSNGVLLEGNHYRDVQFGIEFWEDEASVKRIDLVIKGEDGELLIPVSGGQR